jgi:hypothetical protein
MTSTVLMLANNSALRQAYQSGATPNDHPPVRRVRIAPVQCWPDTVGEAVN